MDAFATTPQLQAPSPGRLVRLLTIVGGDLLLALCLFVFWRRLVGSFDRPLSGSELVAVTLALVLVPCGFRAIWQRSGAAGPGRLQRWVRLAAPTIGVLLLAVAVSLPGSPVWALLLLWCSVAVAEAAWWLVGVRRPGAGETSAVHGRSLAGDGNRAGEAAAATGEGGGLQPRPPEAALPAGVSQRLTRAQDEEGETVHGLLRCEFAPGVRTQNLHIAFCPPLDGTPELNAYQLEGPAVTIKRAQVESFGARLELRLKQAAAADTGVVVEFTARSVGVQEDAGAP